MGHDISAYKKDIEVASLSRSAFSEHKNVIYKALDCKEFNHGVSGNGKSKTFSKNEILKGLSYLKNNYEQNEVFPEIDFLSNCLYNLDKNDKIIIEFY